MISMMSEKLKVKGLESTKFCDACGSFMKRGQDGVLRCSKGHTKIDTITENIQQSKAHRAKILAEENTRLLSSALLDTTGDILIFQLINPFREKQKTGLTPNSSSFKVYEELHNLEKKYPPTKFKYLRGDIFGTKDAKFGHIICTRDIVGDVKTDIEKIDLFEHKQQEGHYILNQYVSLKDIPKGVIAKIVSEIENIKKQ